MDGVTTFCGVVDDSKQIPDSSVGQQAWMETEVHDHTTVTTTEVNVEVDLERQRFRRRLRSQTPTNPQWQRQWSQAVRFTQESKNMQHLRQHSARVELERDDLKRQADLDRKRLREMEENHKKTEKSLQKSITELQAKLKRADEDVSSRLKSVRDNFSKRIKEKDEEIERLLETQREERNKRYELEMEIEELKEANMVVRQPGIDTYVERYETEVSSLRQQLDSERQERLLEIREAEEKLRKEQDSSHDVYQKHEMFLTGVTQIWAVSQTQNTDLLVAKEYESLRQKIVQLNTTVSTRSRTKVVQQGTTSTITKEEELEQSIKKLTEKNVSLSGITANLRAEKDLAEKHIEDLKIKIASKDEQLNKAIADDVGMDQTRGDAITIVTSLHTSFSQFKVSLHKLSEEAERCTFTYEQEVVTEKTTAEITVMKTVEKLQYQLEELTHENKLLKLCLEEMYMFASSELRNSRESSTSVQSPDDALDDIFLSSTTMLPQQQNQAAPIRIADEDG